MTISAAVAAIETRTGASAKLGSPGRKPSMQPSKAAPPYMAAAVYAISSLFSLSLSSERLTPLVSASGRRDKSHRAPPEGDCRRPLRKTPDARKAHESTVA